MKEFENFNNQPVATGTSSSWHQQVIDERLQASGQYT